MSAQREIFDVELRKFGEPSKWEYRANLEREGVETRHGAPKSIIDMVKV